MISKMVHRTSRSISQTHNLPGRSPTSTGQGPRKRATCTSPTRHQKVSERQLPTACQPRALEGEGVPAGLGLGLWLAEALAEGDPAAQWVGQEKAAWAREGAGSAVVRHPHLGPCRATLNLA